MTDLELKKFTTEQLRKKWAEIYNYPAPPSLTKSYLIKELTWQIKYGSLPPSLKKQIDKLVEQYSKTKSVSTNDIKKLQKFKATQGTRLIREFKGKKYEVTALGNGFNYNGKVYKSLSAIANEITGTRWNGKKFFGVAS